MAQDAIAQLAEGVRLRSHAQTLCRGAARNVDGRPGTVELSITAGAFHQVKHMLALVGRPLATLHRLAFANLVTPEDDDDDGGEAGTGTRLRVGMCRELSEAEVGALYALAGGQQPEPESAPAPEPEPA